MQQSYAFLPNFTTRRWRSPVVESAKRAWEKGAPSFKHPRDRVFPQSPCLSRWRTRGNGLRSLPLCRPFVTETPFSRYALRPPAAGATPPPASTFGRSGRRRKAASRCFGDTLCPRHWITNYSRNDPTQAFALSMTLYRQRAVPWFRLRPDFPLSYLHSYRAA